jgi:hypothetical protein
LIKKTPKGTYAVFRHPRTTRNAKFTKFHQNFESARDEAIRLTTECAVKSPKKQHVFYVMQIMSVFEGGKDGFSSEE